MTWHDQEFVTEECFQVVEFLPMDVQVQSVAFAHPREHNSSISNTAKNGAGKFLPMRMQAKHDAFAHLRECKSSVSDVEKNGAGNRSCPATKKMLE